MSVDGSEATRSSTTLRLTLAMRGGVSLAVWIGGAVAELDLLRRASLTPNPTDPRMRRYRALLDAAGYGRVEVDILAGASAGGFNAVLYGLAQSYGASVEPTRDLWANTGGIWQMLRPVGFRPLVSFLQGDDYFLPTARMSLGLLATGESAEYAADNVTVELAATRIDDGTATAWGSRAAFSFVRTAGSLESGFSTIPGAGQNTSDPVVARAIDRLALAARATSSFPAAFEPATIHSVASSAGDSGAHPNMSTVFPFAYDSDRSDRFDVIDGGVLDNIPVDRAIRAIGRAAASSVTERRLFYLDPEPPREPLPMSPVKKFVIHSAVTVISYATALKKRVESAQDELPALRSYNEREQKARSRSAALAVLLERGGDVPVRPVAGEYARYRVDVDAERVADLLTDPTRFTSGAPGFAQPFGRVSESATLPLRSRLLALYVEDPSLVDGDVRAVRDIATLLIAWIRELERLALTGDEDARAAGRNVGMVKSALYRVLTVTFDARRRTVDLVYVRGMGLAGAVQDSLPDIESLAAESARAGRELPELPPFVEAALFARAADDTEYYEDSKFYTALAEWPSLSPGPEGATLQRLWDAVSAARSAIYDHSEAIVVPEANIRWRQTVFARLYSPSWRATPVQDLFTTFAATGDVPGTSSVVQYHEIRGDQFTPLAYGYWLDKPMDPQVDAQIQALIDASMGTWVSRWLHDPTVPVVLRTREKALTTDAKLAGNVVARFGGFLHAGWRVNDWKWGRMDAAAGIVDALGVDPGGRGADIAELQEQILMDAAEVATAPGVVGDSNLAVGAEGARDLAPSYLFALVTRLAVLAPRVLWPSESPITSVKGFGGRIGALVLRPLLPPMVLATDMVRVALAAAAVVMVASVVGMHTITASPTTQRTVLSVVALLTVSVVLRWRSALRRWNAVRTSVNAADETQDKTKHLWTAYVETARAQHVRSIGLSISAAALGLASAVFAIVNVNGPAALGMEATVVVTMVGVAAVVLLDSRTLDVRLTPRRFRRRRVVGGSIAAGLALGAVVVASTDIGVAHSVAVQALSTGILTATLSALSLWGWSARVHAAVWVVGVSALAALTVGVRTPGPTWVVPAGLAFWIVGVSIAYLFVPARTRIEGDGLSPLTS